VVLLTIYYKYKANSEANKETGLEVNAEKIKYMVMSLHQNAGDVIIH